MCFDLNQKYFPIFRRIDDVQTNGDGNENTHIDADGKLSNDGGLSAAYNKRPVSMFEHTSKTAPAPENRTANSMYQIIDGLVLPNSAATNGSNSVTTLPRTEVVKYLTDSVTRRIQELWTAMQEMTSNDAYIPCAERIRVAVVDLTAMFPPVS